MTTLNRKGKPEGIQSVKATYLIKLDPSDLGCDTVLIKVECM